MMPDSTISAELANDKGSWSEKAIRMAESNLREKIESDFSVMVPWIENEFMDIVRQAFDKWVAGEENPIFDRGCNSYQRECLDAQLLIDNEAQTGE